MPEGFLVIDLASGIKIQSYIGMRKTVEMPRKHCKEAAGILKFEPIDLSIVTPCLVNKVDVCEDTMAYTKHVLQIGINLTTDLASSTSLKLQTLLLSLEPSGVSNAL